MGMRKRLRTADYSQQARDRLADAVIKAREADGHRYRPSFAKAAQVSVRSLAAVEQGDSGVGGTILRAIGRALPNWTEDTPQVILDGGPVPSTESEDETFTPRDDFERKVAASGLPAEEQLEWVRAHRVAVEEERTTLRKTARTHPHGPSADHESDTTR